MSKFALEKNKAIVVTRTGSSEQLAKIELIEQEPGKVTLDVEAGSRVSIHTSEEWDQIQSERRAGKHTSATDRPQQKAPYMN